MSDVGEYAPAAIRVGSVSVSVSTDAIAQPAKLQPSDWQADESVGVGNVTPSPALGSVTDSAQVPEPASRVMV